MKKWLCCFSFCLLFLVGAGVGRYGVGRMVFDIVETQEMGEEDFVIDYQGVSWGKTLLWQYIGYYFIVIVLLGIRRRDGLLAVFWFVYGLLLGIYGAGVVAGFGEKGDLYFYLGPVLSGILLSGITGIFWIKWKEYKLPRYYSKKRIRTVLEGVRIRILPFGGFGAGVIMCWLMDYEILHRIRWKILIQMFGNVVN